MSNFAVAGMTVAPPSSVNAAVTVNPVSHKMSAGGNSVHLDGDTITVAAINTATASIPDPGPYTVKLKATQDRLKVNGKAVLMVGDKSEIINATPKTPASPNPIDTPISFQCEIVNAGQVRLRQL